MKPNKKKFLNVKYNSGRFYSEIVWLPATEQLTEILFFQELNKQINHIEKYNPKNLLIDATEFKYNIQPASVNWIKENIIDKYIEYGIKKIAFVNSSMLIPQILIENAMEADTDKILDINYFEQKLDAINWLNPVGATSTSISEIK